MELFAVERESGQINLEESLKFASSFLDSLRISYKDASETEKIELYKILGVIQQDLAAELKKTREKFGMEEEEVLSLCEHPQNFTDKQWAIVQEMRKKIGDINAPSGQKKEALKQKPLKKGKWMRS